MENQSLKTNVAKHPTRNLMLGLGLGLLGVAIAAAGIYVGETDDAPGAALLGIVVMVSLTIFGIRTARRKT